ncbi:MAG TPA: PBP1A family penicillin-binding protein [Candidatus Saccharimonadales bacterium]|nr:PBP1A family penicillin-binding protein [Candidatus Saccharimonadales bacterium]
MPKTPYHPDHKDHNEPEQFYEAMPASAQLSDDSIGLDDLGRAAQAALERLRQEWIRIKPLAQAALDDAGRYGLTFVRTMTSQSARRTYAAGLGFSLIAASAVGVLVASSTYAIYASDLTSPAAVMNKKNTGTTILDRHGEELYQVYGANNRQPINIREVPDSLIQATLAAEDPDFYSHEGVSWRGTARALYQDVINRRKAQGGSTITQQLVKNTLLDPTDRSFERKAREAILALELERRYDKDQIMQMYLNGIYYGQGSHGIGSAAQTYFNKSVKDLSLSQSALLAGLVLAPSQWDPTINPEAALGRRNFILDRMRELGYITPEEVTAAKAEPIEASARQIEIKAPHFVFYVLDELRRQYGSELVEYGGITVRTTLDLGKQQIGEEAVRTQLAGLRGRNATNGALVSLDPKTGEILSMVGSVDYNAPGFGKVNLATALRQPGSAMKPLVYLSAFQKGWNGATVVEDKPIAIPDGAGRVYQPQNYDLKFHGRQTLRSALANSYNIPAVEVLRFVGVPQALDTAHQLGITTLNDPSRYGLSLVLGGGEVRMIDMAAAYGTFANQGTPVTPVSIKQVLNRHNKDITAKPAQTPAKQPVVDPRLVYMLTSILSDNDARSPMFGANSPLKLSRPAAVKTGTTNDYKDNWAAGYTPDVATVVWVGNNNGAPMVNVDGITGAAPIWRDYMEQVMRGTPVVDFAKPAGLETVRVCKFDGGIANPWDASAEEFFLAEAKPAKRCGTSAPRPKVESRPEEEGKKDDPEEDEKPKERDSDNVDPQPGPDSQPEEDFEEQPLDPRPRLRPR